MDFKIKGKMLGQGNFGFCQSQKAWEKESEMFDDPTQGNVAQAPLPFIKIFI